MPLTFLVLRNLMSGGTLLYRQVPIYEDLHCSVWVRIKLSHKTCTSVVLSGHKVVVFYIFFYG